MPKITLKKFREKTQLICNDVSMRLFVCNGSPLDCQIFLVGINPAFTGFKKKESFWQFWNDEEGFVMEDFLNSFRKQRKQLGKPELTKSRDMIEVLRKSLSQKEVSLLDTNVYLRATKRAKALTKTDKKDSGIFWHIVRTIKPKVLYVHGNKPMEVIRRELKLKSMKLNRFYNVKCDDFYLEIFWTNHLSYQMSKDDLRQIAKRLTARSIIKEATCF